MKTNGINVNARLLCGAATFLALAATGAPALAQDAEEPAAVEGAVEGDAIVVTGSGPFADTATFSNVFPILRTDTEGSKSEIFAIGTNLEWKATDNLGFVVDYG